MVAGSVGYAYLLQASQIEHCMLPNINFDAVAVTIPLYSAYGWCQDDDDNAAQPHAAEQDACVDVRDESMRCKEGVTCWLRPLDESREVAAAAWWPARDDDVVKRILFHEPGDGGCGDHWDVRSGGGSPCSASWSSSMFGARASLAYGSRSMENGAGKRTFGCDAGTYGSTEQLESWVRTCSSVFFPSVAFVALCSLTID
jgi:hypothetical protein